MVVTFEKLVICFLILNTFLNTSAVMQLSKERTLLLAFNYILFSLSNTIFQSDVSILYMRCFLFVLDITLTDAYNGNAHLLHNVLLTDWNCHNIWPG